MLECTTKPATAHLAITTRVTHWFREWPYWVGVTSREADEGGLPF